MSRVSITEVAQRVIDQSKAAYGIRYLVGLFRHPAATAQDKGLIAERITRIIDNSPDPKALYIALEALPELDAS